MRLFVDTPLQPGAETALPESADRHARVRRVQPGDTLVLLDGHGAEWPATVLQVGRSEIRVRVGEPQAVSRELPLPVTLAVVVPANERMDWLVEKATELGAAAVQPLWAERSVLRLAGDRSAKRLAHWHGIVRAASEQCGRTQLMQVAPPCDITDWLARQPPPPRPHEAARWMLDFADDARAPGACERPAAITALSGPEGGLTADERAAARAAGFRPVTLGPRVLRADTAPLALLAWAGLGL
ncbi:MAG: 16S rRNA (uracil(1498)-N(3))-methyltransferase [Rubrivivax sp.]|nr:16S rRNA (uracil(1498)-N(3))-methyltransferase [Rubrivivax sp.]